MLFLRRTQLTLLACVAAAISLLSVQMGYARVGDEVTYRFIESGNSVSMQSRATGAGAAASRASAGARSSAARAPVRTQSTAGRASRTVAQRARPVARAAGRAAAGARSGAARLFTKARSAVRSGVRSGVRAVSMKSSKQQRPVVPVRRPIAVSRGVKGAFNRAARGATTGSNTRTINAAVKAKPLRQSGNAWRAPTRGDVRGSGVGGRSPSLLTPVFNRASSANSAGNRTNATAGSTAAGRGGRGTPAPVLRIPGPRF